MSATPCILCVTDVTHTYRQGRQAVHALRGVSLSVRANEIFGLLGQNGAGKTTLLSCIEGLITPAEGQLQVNGHDVRTQPALAKQQLGIQLQRAAMIEELTAAELLETYAGMYSVYLNTGQIDGLLTRFDLCEQRNKLARRMSGGQQQRLALALAVANNPNIVLLDEPTEALDPQARRLVWGLIRELRAEGRTILMTTHQMDEAEQLCDRVAIMKGGCIIACDSPSALIAQLRATPVIRAAVELPLADVQALPGVVWARYTGTALEAGTRDATATMAALASLAQRHNRQTGDVMLRQPNLEDVYLKLTA